MTLQTLRHAADNWFATLNAALDNSQTTLVLSSSGATGAPETPFYLNVLAEIMECTNVAADTPSGGLDTLTVVRGVLGSSATTHQTTETVEQCYYAAYVEEPRQRLMALEALVGEMLGRRTGVQRTGSDDNLLVVGRSQPNLIVDIGRGAGVVNGNPVAIHAATTLLLIAPTGPQWYALVEIDEDSTISAKYDVSTPVTVDADATPLAELLIDTGGNIISTTDRREFL